MGLFGMPFMSSIASVSDNINIEQPIAPARPIPNLPQGPISLGGLPGTVSGNVPSTSVQQPGGTIGGLPDVLWGQSTPSNTQQTPSVNLPGTSIPDVLSNTPTGTNLPNTAAPGSGPLSWILNSRMMSGAVGLIAIAAGLMLFKPSQDIIVQTSKTAAKLAA